MRPMHNPEDPKLYSAQEEAIVIRFSERASRRGETTDSPDGAGYVCF